MADESRRGRRQQSPPDDRDFEDGSTWVTPMSLRPGEIKALADKFSNRPFEEMLSDREFLRLSDEDRAALAAEFRRRASIARGAADGEDSRGRRTAAHRRRIR